MSKAAAHGCVHIYKSLSIYFLLTVPLVRLVLAARVKAADDGASAVHRIVVFSAPTRREYERELKEARERAEAATAEVRRHRELAEHKLTEQHALLAAVARLAAGDQETPIVTPPGGSQAELAVGLERWSGSRARPDCWPGCGTQTCWPSSTSR